MSAYRFVTLTCDRCGEIFDPGTETSVRAVRGMARPYGWQIRWGQNRRMQDWCGMCCGTHERVPGVGDTVRIEATQ